MKRSTDHLLLSVLTVFCIIIFLAGCKKDNTTKTYTIERPVYKDKSAVLSEINGTGTEPIRNAGKIYIKDNFIFLNEIDKGIHVINNADRSHPVQVAFLNIPGNQDIAVKGNILYADMYSDLLALDITDASHVRATKVLPNFFTERAYINGFFVDSNQVIVDWIKKDTTVPVENVNPPVSEACPECFFDAAGPLAS